MAALILSGHGKLAVMPVRVKLCPSVMINAASTASILVPDISPITGINSGINVVVMWRAVFLLRLVAWV
jgi:hypothetical protein